MESKANTINHNHAPTMLSKWTESLTIVPRIEGGGEGPAKTESHQSNISSSDDYAQQHYISSHAASSSKKGKSMKQQQGIEVNISSFNILAESYLTPRSHKNLPETYAEVVFDKTKRRVLLRDILIKLASEFDILCLQEVDNLLFPMIEECLTQDLDFGYVYSPRNKHEKPDVSDDNYNDNYASGSGIDIKKNKMSMGDSLEDVNAQDTELLRGKNKKKDSRSDGCATFYNRKKWKCMDFEVVHFDDLADETRPSLHSIETPAQSECEQSDNKNDDQTALSDQNTATLAKGSSKQVKAKNAIPGIISSYQRRNTALILRLRSKSNATILHHQQQQQLQNFPEIVVGNAHLYWHPGYEFVKLSQAHYLLHKIKYFAMNAKNNNNFKESDDHRTPVIVCGDMNSKPKSVVHQYFTKGCVDARTVAPWNCQYDPELGESQFDNDDGLNQDPIIGIDGDGDGDNNDYEELYTKNDGEHKMSNEKDLISLSLSAMDIQDKSRSRQNNNSDFSRNQSNSTQNTRPSYGEDDDSSTAPKYLLDITLNKLTRWLRILGLDAALETDEEEKARTGEGKMIIFERCRKERRLLITTSKTLLRRKECPPGTYLVHPRTVQDLQAALVHLLLLHSIKLQPRKFLTSCVVCNGIIKEVHEEPTKKAIFKEFGYPGFGEDLDVYKCNGCGQGYWWSDSPQSSASRVKDTAANILRNCVRGGVPIEGDLGIFDFVDIEKERKAGEMERMQSGTTGGIDEVMEWLRDENLRHDFELRSGYASNRENNDNGSELYPFTNVTADFIGALDYIFFEQTKFHQHGQLFIPTNLRTLNPEGLINGHLLPSNVWPSDHLSIGVKLTLDKKEKRAIEGTEDESLKEETWKRTNQEAPEEIVDPVKAMLRQMQPNRNPDHPDDCAKPCCVPPTLSLFQMAELRKQAKLKAKKSLFLKKKPTLGSKTK